MNKTKTIKRSKWEVLVNEPRGFEDKNAEKNEAWTDSSEKHVIEKK